MPDTHLPFKSSSMQFMGRRENERNARTLINVSFCFFLPTSFEPNGFPRTHTLYFASEPRMVAKGKVMPGMTPYSVSLAGGTGFCNALRRTLISDIYGEAPYKVTVRKNTSYQTDEFIAHRIGMIPFRRVGNGDTMHLHVQARDATSADFTGSAFVPCSNAVVMRMNKGQELDVTVHFDRQLGSKHARYAMCAAVRMQDCPNHDDRCRISFETIDGTDGKHMMLQALDRLESRVDDALLQIHDNRPIKSMC